ncbi:MAG: alpha/beta hydrolase [Phyllobacteriaceae bacterium]|jgi:pimeloyl-ACP methyl ester carboxylesterase|nr:alpha/beta hydrolase [Phyllobacteriaceae bacterium]
MEPVTLSTHMIDGIEFAERPGDGPAMVMLHGIGSNAASWAPVMAYLPAGWRLIAWNAPGYGRSEPLASDWPVAADYAAALLRLIDGLGLERFGLAGHSLGALMASSFAVSHSERVTQLVLAAPALGHGVRPGGVLSDKAQARIDDLERLGPDDFAKARAAALVHAPEDNPAIVSGVRKAMAQVRMPGYGQAVRMLASGRLLDDVARLTVRTDIVTGAEDRITPPDGARQAHDRLAPDYRGGLVEVPHRGHAITQQAPGAVAELLARATTPA